MKEKVKYVDETEIEFEVYSLSYRKVRQLIDKYIPIDRIKIDSNKNPVLPDDFKASSLFNLMEECICTIKGIDLDKIHAEEIGRIYQKYFEKSIMMGLGGKGDPNLKEGLEQ